METAIEIAIKYAEDNIKACKDGTMMSFGEAIWGENAWIEIRRYLTGLLPTERFKLEKAFEAGSHWNEKYNKYTDDSIKVPDFKKYYEETYAK
jgi:hypothetical protein